MYQSLGERRGLQCEISSGVRVEHVKDSERLLMVHRRLRLI